MKMMKAVVAYGAKDFRFEEIPVPEARPGEILVKVKATGICASDRSIYFGGDPWGGVKSPHVPGHEFVGEIIKIDPETSQKTNLIQGDHVTAEICVPCRTCFYCTKGLYHLCENMSSWVGGSWAEYMVFPEGAIVYKVPKSIPETIAAIIEPLACSCHAVNRADIQQYDTVIISGLGSIGMGALQIARLRSPYCLIGLEPDEHLRKIAGQLGADVVLDPREENLEDKIMELTNGRGVDKYLECSGNPVSLQTGFKLIRKRGRLVVYGVYKQDVLLDFNQVGEFKEFEIFGGHLSPWSYDSVIKYLANGQVDGKAMVTHIFPLQQFEDALLAKKQEHSIKTVLIPGE